MALPFFLWFQKKPLLVCGLMVTVSLISAYVTVRGSPPGDIAAFFLHVPTTQFNYRESERFV